MTAVGLRRLQIVREQELREMHTDQTVPFGVEVAPIDANGRSRGAVEPFAEVDDLEAVLGRQLP